MRHKFFVGALSLLAIACNGDDKSSILSSPSSAGGDVSAVGGGVKNGVVMSPNSSSTDSKNKWRIVQQLHSDWAGDGVGYDFVLSIPEGWDDPGDYTRLEVVRNHESVLTVSDDSGLVGYKGEVDKSVVAQAINSLMPSPYLLMIPLKGERDLSVIFSFGYQYASSPGSLRIMSLDKNGVPKEIFYLENFMVASVVDLDGDSVKEMVGKKCYSQGWGNDFLTYDPYTVYKFLGGDSLSVKADLPLTEKYNKENYYGWAGPDCSEDVTVVLHPPGTEKPMIMSSKEAEELFQKK